MCWQQLDGAEAVRKQTLENKYAEMERTGRGAEVPAERAKDDAARHAEITGKIAQRVNVYRDELEAIQQERDELLDIIGANAATLDQQRASGQRGVSVRAHSRRLRRRR